MYRGPGHVKYKMETSNESSTRPSANKPRFEIKKVSESVKLISIKFKKINFDISGML